MSATGKLPLRGHSGNFRTPMLLSHPFCGFLSLSLENGLFPPFQRQFEVLLFKMSQDCVSCKAEMPLRSWTYSFGGFKWIWDISPRGREWKAWRSVCVYVCGWVRESVCACVWVCVCGERGAEGCSWPIQHIWNIWGLEVCSNAERHSETHKETFSPSFLFFFHSFFFSLVFFLWSKTSSSEIWTIFRQATDKWLLLRLLSAPARSLFFFFFFTRHLVWGLKLGICCTFVFHSVWAWVGGQSGSFEAQALCLVN